MRLLLVHSPLVGPATWRGVARALVSSGHRVDLPDLRQAAQSGEPRQFVSAAQSAIRPDTRVIVGHSGAGFFLPSIAAGRQHTSLIFLDAGVPPARGTATASADFLDQLRAMAVDGLLPRWSRWWGDGVLERLVPDAEFRLEIESELPEVPLAFYETPITMPDDWRSAPCGLILLSEGYSRDAATATSLGWPTVELVGSHLDLVNRPDEIARAIIRMTASAR